MGPFKLHLPTFEDLKDKVNELLVCFEKSNSEVLGLFGLYEGLHQ